MRIKFIRQDGSELDKNLYWTVVDARTTWSDLVKKLSARLNGEYAVVRVYCQHRITYELGSLELLPIKGGDRDALVEMCVLPLRRSDNA